MKLSVLFSKQSQRMVWIRNAYMRTYRPSYT